MEPLSQFLSLLDVDGLLSARIEARGRWALRFPIYGNIKFGAVLEGRCWLSIEGSDDPVEINTGDFYLLSGIDAYRIASDPTLAASDGLEAVQQGLGEDGIVRLGTGAERTTLLGGLFAMSADASDLIALLMPPLICVRADSPAAQPLRAALDLVRLESETILPGSLIASHSLANLALVGVLRAHMQAKETPPSWLGALADPRIAPALNVMHGDVGRRWTVEELAGVVGMSRTSFSERFKASVGLSPLEYLIGWRMSVAKEALAQGRKSIALIANETGYGSESAFSNAFKRVTGSSPGHFRQQRRMGTDNGVFEGAGDPEQSDPMPRVGRSNVVPASGSTSPVLDSAPGRMRA